MRIDRPPRLTSALPLSPARPRRASAAVASLALRLAPLCATLGACAPHFARAASAPTTTAAAARSHDARPLHWTAQHHDTLALWIDSAGVTVAGWRPELVGLITEATAQWRDAGAPIRFVRVATAAAADVRVRWAPWRAGTTARGTTTWGTNASGELVGADVEIVLAPAVRQPPSPTCLLRAIALHEIGHAMGLPHDPARNAIMYPQTGTLVLSDSDRDAVRAAYGGGG